jgi:hypothetical protein
MKKLRTSPDKYTFQKENYIKRCKEKDQAPNMDYLNFWEKTIEARAENERNIAWIENNMEYDLLMSDYIAEKCKDDKYAQNLYAALCNNSFIKNEVWPILVEKTWSCSWRYAGGIVANIRQEGDYIDWYCTGSNYDPPPSEDLDHLNLDELMRYKESQAYVGEGCITDEIREDLFKLGWIVYAETK